MQFATLSKSTTYVNGTYFERAEIRNDGLLNFKIKTFRFKTKN